LTAQYTGVVFNCLPDLLALASIGLNLAMNDLFLAGIFFLIDNCFAWVESKFKKKKKK